MAKWDDPWKKLSIAEKRALEGVALDMFGNRITRNRQENLVAAYIALRGKDLVPLIINNEAIGRAMDAATEAEPSCDIPQETMRAALEAAFLK